jgi:uncharacterized membrane protein
MAWTGPAYIVTGFLAALAGWVAVVGVRRGLLSAGVVVALALGGGAAGRGDRVPLRELRLRDHAGARVAGMVPVVIPLSWFVMLFASFAIAARCGLGAAGTCVVAALGLVAWDVLMDRR